MEQAGNPNEASLWRRRDKRHTSFRNVFGEGFFNHYCAGLGGLQRGQVLAAFHEGHIIPAGQMQWRDAAEKPRVIPRGRKPKRGTKRAKRYRPGRSVKAAIRSQGDQFRRGAAGAGAGVVAGRGGGAADGSGGRVTLLIMRLSCTATSSVMSNAGSL